MRQAATIHADQDWDELMKQTPSRVEYNMFTNASPDDASGLEAVVCLAAHRLVNGYRSRLTQ